MKAIIVKAIIGKAESGMVLSAIQATVVESKGLGNSKVQTRFLLTAVKAFSMVVSVVESEKFH